MPSLPACRSDAGTSLPLPSSSSATIRGRRAAVRRSRARSSPPRRRRNSTPALERRGGGAARRQMAGRLFLLRGRLSARAEAAAAAAGGPARAALLPRRVRRPVGDAPARRPRAARPTGRSSTRARPGRFDGLREPLRARCTGICARATATRRNLTFPVEAQLDRRSAGGLRRADRAPAGEIRRAGRARRPGRSCRARPNCSSRSTSDGWIETHPMKGTAPRGATPAEDERAEALPAQRPEEPGREPDDRRPAAQRHLADQRGRHARRAGAVPHRDLSDRAPDGQHGAGKAAART